MTTTQEIQQRYQRMRNMGMAEADIQRELQLQMNTEHARAEAAARAAAEAAAPAERPPAEWEVRLADGERRWAAHWDTINNPLRANHAAAQRARIEAQARPLVEQRDALNRQIAALDEEHRRWM